MNGFQMPKAILQREREKDKELLLIELKSIIEKKYKYNKEQISSKKILEQSQLFFKQLQDIIDKSIEKTGFLFFFKKLKIKNHRELYEAINILLEDQSHKTLQQNISSFSEKISNMKSLFLQEIQVFKDNIENDVIQEFSSNLNNLCQIQTTTNQKFKDLQLSRIILCQFSFSKVDVFLKYEENTIKTSIQQEINKINSEKLVKQLIQKTKELEQQFQQYFQQLLNEMLNSLEEQMNKFYELIEQKQKPIIVQRQFKTLSWNPTQQKQKKIIVWIGDNDDLKKEDQSKFEQIFNNQQFIYLKSINDLQGKIEEVIKSSNQQDRNLTIQSYHAINLMNQRFEIDQKIEKQKLEVSRIQTEIYINNQQSTIQNQRFATTQRINNEDNLNESFNFMDQIELLNDQSQLNQSINIEQQSEIMSSRINQTIQSMIWKKELCDEIESNNKSPSIEVYLILYGKQINQSLNKLPKQVKFVAIFSKNTNKYKINLKAQDQIISDNIDQIFDKINDHFKLFQTIYNCPHLQLNNYFQQRNPLEYLSLQTFCAKEIQQKSFEELQLIVNKICNSYPNKQELQRINQDFQDKLARNIQQGFKTIDNVITLYTKNETFCNFINRILTRFNEEVLVNASYIIQTLRYALSAYNDEYSDQFKQPNFTVYRGIEVNVNDFKQQYPIGSKFVTFNFSSSSLKEERAKAFSLKSCFLLEITFNAINEDTFEKCRPKFIQKLSKYKDEEEVLFNCFSSFVVKGYKILGDKSKNQIEYTVAQLEFLENPVI